MVALRMSLGDARDFARHTFEVCRRDGVAVGALLEELGLEEFVKNVAQPPSAVNPLQVGKAMVRGFTAEGGCATGKDPQPRAAVPQAMGLARDSLPVKREAPHRARPVKCRRCAHACCGRCACGAFRYSRVWSVAMPSGTARWVARRSADCAAARLRGRRLSPRGARIESRGSGASDARARHGVARAPRRGARHPEPERGSMTTRSGVASSTAIASLSRGIPTRSPGGRQKTDRSPGGTEEDRS